jgi:crotonobetainyl-CoA:carnitine CoA-transferase CaiB-like acyl-CoA transferase
MMGARVVKVESSGRPDGMRYAGGGFYDLLNAGKASVALDFNLSLARAQLRQLLLRADIVIEASRPRALRQLGILAEQILEENPGLTWIAISGHGREEPAAGWIAYGDDGAVAGGLSQVMWDCSGRAMFCGDAIADPLTGLHAALAAWSSFERGGGRLLSLALRDVVAHCVAFAGLPDRAASQACVAEWNRHVRESDVAAPSSRAINDKARTLGADTLEVLSGAGTGR